MCSLEQPGGSTTTPGRRRESRLPDQGLEPSGVPREYLLPGVRRRAVCGYELPLPVEPLRAMPSLQLQQSRLCRPLQRVLYAVQPWTVQAVLSTRFVRGRSFKKPLAKPYWGEVWLGVLVSLQATLREIVIPVHINDSLCSTTPSRRPQSQTRSSACPAPSYQNPSSPLVHQCDHYYRQRARTCQPDGSWRLPTSCVHVRPCTYTDILLLSSS